jgi:acyl-CoA dehydrogenase
MSIDFTLPPDVEETRARVREFMDEVVRPAEEKVYANAPNGEPDRSDIVRMIIELRQKAHEWNVWLPHMPKEWGGLGLGITAMAFVSAESARTNFGPFILNAQAPDEGNQHTLLHHANDEQKEKYLRPLLEGRVRSCFAMTEPEVAGSDPTGIRTMAVQDGDEWVVNGHKWFISGAKGATFAILIAKTDPDADPPQASNTAFLVDLPADGWEIVRDIDTMAGHGNHCEIRITDLRLPDSAILGGRGNGHLLGQARLGPARLAHCMRWIGQTEVALEMLVKRAEERQLHAAYKIEHEQPFRQEVSFAKHHVANMLWKVVDRAIQVHGALGYSTDTPLERMMKHARSARLVDGADEVHQALIARNVRAAIRDTGNTRTATGDFDF